MLCNVLLKAGINCKFSWVDGLSLFSNSIFQFTLMAFSKRWSRILDL